MAIIKHYIHDFGFGDEYNSGDIVRYSSYPPEQITTPVHHFDTGITGSARTKRTVIAEYKTEDGSPIVTQEWKDDPSRTAFIQFNVDWSQRISNRYSNTSRSILITGIHHDYRTRGFEYYYSPFSNWSTFRQYGIEKRTSQYKVISQQLNTNNRRTFVSYFADVSKVIRDIVAYQDFTHPEGFPSDDRLYFVFQLSTRQDIPADAWWNPDTRETHYLEFADGYGPLNENGTLYTLNNPFYLGFTVPERLSLSVDSVDSGSSAECDNSFSGVGDEVYLIPTERNRNAVYDTSYLYAVNNRHQLQAVPQDVPDHHDQDGYLKFGRDSGYGVDSYVPSNQEGKPFPAIPLEGHTGSLTLSVWFRAYDVSFPYNPYYKSHYNYSVFGNGDGSKGIEFGFSGLGEKTINPGTYREATYNFTNLFFRVNSSDYILELADRRLLAQYSQRKKHDLFIWNHYCLVFYSGGSARLVVTDENGDKVYEGTMPSSNPKGSGVPIRNLSNNSIGNVASNTATKPFQGDIKDLRLFSRDLSLKEQYRLAENPGASGRIFGLSVRSNQSLPQVDSPDVKVPTCIAEESASQPEVQQVYIKPPVEPLSSESITQSQLLNLRHYLQVPEVQSSFELQSFRLGPFSFFAPLSSVESDPKVSVALLDVGAQLRLIGSESKTLASDVSININVIRSGVRGAPQGPDVNADGEATENAWFCPSINSDMSSLENGGTSEDLSYHDYDAHLTVDPSNTARSLLVDDYGYGGSNALRVGRDAGHVTLPQFVHNGYFDPGDADALFSNWTVSLWWKPSVNSIAGQFFRSRHQYLVDTLDDTRPSFGGLRLRISYHPETNVPAFVRFGPPSVSGESPLTISVQGNVRPGEWNHIVASVNEKQRSDGLPANTGEISLYVNGLLAQKKNAIAVYPEYSDIRATMLMSGISVKQSEEGTSIGVTDGFGAPSGLIDDVRSYTHSLSDEEIRWLYLGNGSGGRGVIGEPFFPYDIQSSSEVSAVLISVDARVDSSASTTQVSETNLLVRREILPDDIQSSTEVSETELLVRNFAANRDPLIIGDRMSESKERAVIEFSISNMAARFPVYLRMNIEDVNNDFLAVVGRWISPWPTNYLELQNGDIANKSRVNFIPAIGEISVDVSQMVYDAKNAGDSTVAICLLEQPNHTDNYYEVDNSASLKPTLSFSTVTPITVDSVECQPEYERFALQVDIYLDSCSSASNASDVNVQSDTLYAPSVESISENEILAEFSVSSSLDLDSAESSLQLSDTNVETDYLFFGYKKNFVRAYQPTAVNMTPFRGEYGWYYDPSDPSGIVNDNTFETQSRELPVRVKIENEGTLKVEWSIMISSFLSGQTQSRGRSVKIQTKPEIDATPVTLDTITDQTIDDYEITIPAGDYYLSFIASSPDSNTTPIYLEKAELRMSPSYADDVESSSQCSEVNINVDLTADSSESQAECEETNVRLSGYVLDGSFEQSDEGWTNG